MAFAELKAWATPVDLRVKRDEEGYPIIPGRLGRIEWTGEHRLAVYSNHPRVFPKLFAVDGIIRHQIGDGEIRLLFPPAALSQIAQVIRAYRKPGLRSAEARRMGAKTAFKASSASKKATAMGRRRSGAR